MGKTSLPLILHAVLRGGFILGKDIYADFRQVLVKLSKKLEKPMIKKIILTGALLAIAAVPAQAKLQGERVFTTEDGKWEVIRDVDSFTDEVTCTVAYVEDNGIQAGSDGSLYVSVKGGIRGYQMRQDDKPAGDMKVASNTEKQIDALVISEPWFEKLFEGDRLRIQVITWTNGLVNIDLNTANLQEAYEAIPSCESGTI